MAREKNDLREEKASLQSDIEKLNCQYQQQLRTVSPWTAMDHSVMVVPPSYPYPVPMPIPPSPIAMQPYPFYANQHSAIIPNPCPTYVPYLVPNTLVEQQSIQHIAPPLHPGFQSHMSGKQESRNKCKESMVDKHEDSNDVTADQTSGFSADQVSVALLLKKSSNLYAIAVIKEVWIQVVFVFWVLQDLSSGQIKSSELSRRQSSCTEVSSLGRCSSSRSVEESSSSSVVHQHKG